MTARVRRALSSIVLFEARLYIGRDAGVQTSTRTAQDVDGPGGHEVECIMQSALHAPRSLQFVPAVMFSAHHLEHGAIGDDVHELTIEEPLDED